MPLNMFGAATARQRKHTDRNKWNAEYAAALSKIMVSLSQLDAIASAAASDDAFNDDVDPDEAAADEASYWTDDEGAQT